MMASFGQALPSGPLSPPLIHRQPSTVLIISRTGAHMFHVELATTDAEREQGLRFRNSLPDGRGMLFDFAPERYVTMNMHNVVIPLDMIFIRSERIVRIEEDIEPNARRVIYSLGPVDAVLEVLGGTAKRRGIEVGDRVTRDGGL